MKRFKRLTAIKIILPVLIFFGGLLFAAGEEIPADNPAEGSSGKSQRALLKSETAAEKHRREITEEASSQLFKMDIWDTNVSLFISGYWKVALSVNWGLGNSPLGTAPDTKETPLLFTQEADLLLSLWIWQKWFLEASFLDNYHLNTYRAGYQGLPGEPIQYVGIGNTGLDFPIYPYLDLGGDSPSSFGVYGRFGSGKISYHALIRYDAAAREERFFVGNRERSFTTIIPDKPLRGRSFVLPDYGIASIPVVYFEDKNGPLPGGGIRWRAAKPSEYAASAVNGLLELVRGHTGMVAVSYTGVSLTGTPGLGSYASPPGPNNFLRAVQDHFDDDPSPTITLADYPHPGAGLPLEAGGIPGIVHIDGVPALVIYEPGAFSPFERLSRYQSPSNTTEDAVLIRSSSGEALPGFEVLPANTLSMDLSMYAITGDDSNRGIFEIVYQNYGRERRDPLSSWPLAGDYPELYLPGAPAIYTDVRLRFTSYGDGGAYNIGTDVIPGSVQVYRGGILDSQINFDPGSGVVTLTSPVGFNEVIRITYLKRSEERRLGSLAAGAGLLYKPEESHFSAEAALGMRWNISREAYSEDGATSPGTVALSARASWDYDKIKAALSLGLGFEHPDTTGLYRIAGMEGSSEIVLALSLNSGFFTETPAKTDPVFPAGLPPIPPVFPPYSSIDDLIKASAPLDLIYRNYRRNNWLGVSGLEQITWDAPVITTLEGPYPARDSNIDVFVADFESLGPGEWTGFQVPLGREGELLEQARGIVIPIRFYENAPAALDNILVIAQFGALKDNDAVNFENPNLMVEFPLFFGQPSSKWVEGNDSTGINGTLHVSAAFTDDMRRKLHNAAQMRIIILNCDPSLTLPGNRLIAAKPFIMGASWRAITADTGVIKAATDETGIPGAVTVLERLDASLPKNKTERFHIDTANHVLEVRWKNTGSAGTDSRTSYIPLPSYQALSFFLKGPVQSAILPGDYILPPGSEFHFLISPGPESYPGNCALEITIQSSDFPTGYDPLEWHRVEIRYLEKKVIMDGSYEIPAVIDYNPKKMHPGRDFGILSDGGQSGYIAVFVTGLDDLKSGSFSIDEICLEEASPSYRINGGASFDWRHPGVLLGIGDFPVFSGAVFNTALESAVTGNPFTNNAQTFAGLQSRSYGEISIFGALLSGNLNFLISNDINYWGARHSLGRSFGPFSFKEIFNDAPAGDDESMNHLFSLNLSTPLYANISASVDYQNKKLTRLWDAKTGLQSKTNGHPGFSLEGTLNYTEKTEKIHEWLPNYARAWAKSWTILVPDKGSGSADRAIQNRDMRGQADFTLDFEPIGANLLFEGKSSVSMPFETTKSQSLARIESPFNFNGFRGRLRLQREISHNLYYAGNTLGDDFIQYGKSFSNASKLWLEVPVYALFDPKLKSGLENTLAAYSSKPENFRFNESLAFTMNFPEMYNWLSLIVPVTLYTQLDRNLEQRMDTTLDVLSFSAGLGFSSINLFGAMGSNSLFKFYRNDEFRSSFSAAFSIPRNEDLLWRLQTEQQMRFYGFGGGELDIQNTFSYTGGSSSAWTESFIVMWIIPREKTLLFTIYSLVMNKLAGTEIFPSVSDLAMSEHEKLFRESFELVLDHSDEFGVYSFTLGHESVVRVIGKLALTGFAKLGFQRNERFNSFNFLLSFGTTLNISF